MKRNQLRLRFLIEFGHNLAVVWPVLSAIVLLMLLVGSGCAWLEHWPVGDGVYFALITGFTVGYGDFVPHHPLSRACAVCLAFLGIVLTAIIAAAAVRALNTALDIKR